MVLALQGFDNFDLVVGHLTAVGIMDTDIHSDGPGGFNSVSGNQCKLKSSLKQFFNDCSGTVSNPVSENKNSGRPICNTHIYIRICGSLSAATGFNNLIEFCFRLFQKMRRSNLYDVTIEAAHNPIFFRLNIIYGCGLNISFLGLSQNFPSDKML